MVGEEFLRLFEHNWSEKPIFMKDKEPLNLNEEEVGEKEDEAVKKFLVKRAMSDETMMMMTSYVSSSDDLFSSPRSVLTVKASPTKLQTILSGKEVNEFSTAERERTLSEHSEKEEQRKKKQRDVRKRTRKGKSMSDLEFEELKGFIDLGFVFSEEDQRDSELVSILPGLQRLVKKDDGVGEVTEEEKDISNGNRPYLSEAWDHCGGRKGKRNISPAIKWKVPAAAPEVKEVELKDQLKQWAHAVASTIR
ncbi:unnamed protein product [Eruca vesicaria subsp. sativa]|uniref:Uncharacterized protein n=1 Tax=Eruca vesicaria subsp. sativa TaxID=29727 RepID=A0ABC8LPR3_ERUVS|nr:unnamed protein product [Eruca vesicaria subsp. sativa]